MTNTNPTELSSPFEINSRVTLKNRFFKSAMSEQLGDRFHAPKPELPRLYRTWAEGGAGLLVTGNVMIDSRYLGEAGNVVLENETHLEAFRAWAQAGAGQGAQFWMQLNHPGKQIPSFLCKEPVAPSAIPLGTGLEKMFNTPRALTEDEIQEIIGRFASSAALAKKAGFQGVQIHSAHGYLVNQFLSPRHNQRADRWGGSAENRMRFPLEVYRAVRQAVGADFPIGIKLNSADFMRGGFTEEESMAVVRALAGEGIDLIEISGGTYESPSMMGSDTGSSSLKREAYFLVFAEKVRTLVDTPIVVTGGFRSERAMTEALQSGATDLIGLARPLAVEPDLPKRLLSAPGQSIELQRPSTGIKALDRAALLDITWYEQQLHRLGKGALPKQNFSAWMSVALTLLDLGVGAFRKRRA